MDILTPFLIISALLNVLLIIFYFFFRNKCLKLKRELKEVKKTLSQVNSEIYNLERDNVAYKKMILHRIRVGDEILYPKNGEWIEMIKGKKATIIQITETGTLSRVKGVEGNWIDTVDSLKKVIFLRNEPQKPFENTLQ